LSASMAKRKTANHARNQTPVAQPVASLYCLRHSCCLQLSQTNTVSIHSFVRNLENKKTGRVTKNLRYAHFVKRPHSNVHAQADSNAVYKNSIFSMLFLRFATHLVFTSIYPYHIFKSVGDVPNRKQRCIIHSAPTM